MELFIGFLSALGCSLFASVANSFVSWLLLFRSASFRAAAANLEKKREALAELKERDEDKVDKTTTKRIKRLESDISSLSMELSRKSAVFNIVSAVMLFGMNQVFRSGFAGIVVAKIPFEPFGLFTRLTHSGIENEDMHDGSFQYVYWLGSLLFRDVLTKWFGFQVPQVSMTDQVLNMPK